MTPRRPASGRRVGQGVIRVDARRAIAKLREYQLPDRSAWVLEGIRAAVASGASRVDLQGDSNDVWLRWWGPPIPQEHLPRLLDTLVSPATAQQGPELRLLAIAVNSALGMAPGHVDIFARYDEQALKVRYTPALLASEDASQALSKLDALAFEECPMPTRAEDATMFVHLRRVFGRDQMRNFFRGGPPELALARACCQDLGVPITIGNGEYGAHLNTSDLLRVAIGRGIEGHMALTLGEEQATSNLAQLQVAEHGVLITSYGIQLGGPDPRAKVPIRIWVNARRMPTNASRTEVRRSAHPIDAVEKAKDELCVALTWLIAQALEADSAMDAVTQERVRGGALGLLASTEACELSTGPPQPSRLPSVYRALEKVLLLRNAVGERKSLADTWERNLVHRGHSAYPEAKRDWLGNILWIPPGDATEKLGPFEEDAAALRARVRTATRYVDARRKFEAHACREPQFDRLPRYWVHASLNSRIAQSATSHEPTAATEFKGEICLLQRGQGGVIRLLLEAREIEELRVDSPLAFEAIATSPLLAAAPDYRSVQRDETFDALVRALRVAALRCVEAMCLDGAEGFVQYEAAPSTERRKLVHAALLTAFELQLPLSQTPLLREPSIALLGGSFASIDELRKEKVIATTPSRASCVAPMGRKTVVCETTNTQALLSYSLPPRVKLVHYDPSELRPSSTPEVTLGKWLLETSAEGLALAVRDRNFTGAICFSAEPSSLSIFHRGKHLIDVNRPSTISQTRIAVDSDALVPTPDWRGVRDAAGLDTHNFQAWEAALVQSVLMALAGKAPDDLLIANAAKVPSSSALHRVLGVLIASANLIELLGEKLHNALPSMPLFELLSGSRHSALKLAETFPEAIDYLDRAPLELPGASSFDPLLGNDVVAAFAGRLARRKIRRADQELARRLAQVKRDENLRQHRKQRLVSPQLLADTYAYTVEFKAEGAKGVVAVGPATEQPRLELLLLVESREFARLVEPAPMSLVASLELDLSCIDDRFEGLVEGIVPRLRSSILGCGPRLLHAALRASPSAFWKHPSLCRFCAQWLAADGASPSLQEELAAILDLARFPDQEGRPIDLRAACSSGRLRVSASVTTGWIGPENSSDLATCDQPMVVIPDVLAEEVFRFLALLVHPIAIEDVTDDARSLQIRRGIERGLLLSPTVSVEAPWKRSLYELGDTRSIGEIGLYNGDNARLTLWENGQPKHTLRLSLPWPVDVAIDDEVYLAAAEAGRLAWEDFEGGLRGRITTLTRALLREFLQSKIEIDEWLRIGLSRALLSGTLAPNKVDGLVQQALFVTTAGTCKNWLDLQEQVALLGSIWHTEEGNRSQPLDERRFALALTKRERSLPFAQSLALVAAEIELSLDGIARGNRKTVAIEELVLDGEQERAAFATGLLLDESSGATGVVAPLLPEHADKRGVHAHREMLPIGVGPDPCAWPTLAIVDCAQLTPNRTWSAPQFDETWKGMCVTITQLSEKILAQHFSRSPDYLTGCWIGPDVESLGPSYLHRKQVVRGRLHVTNSSGPGQITFQWKGGRQNYAPIAFRRGEALALPLHGTLLCHSEAGEPDGQQIVQELTRLLYPKLLEQLSQLKNIDEDTRDAHYAIGLASGDIDALSMGGRHFAGFIAGPLSAKEMARWLDDDGPVAVGEVLGDADGIGILDDGTELSRALIRLTEKRRSGNAAALAPFPESDFDPTPTLARSLGQPGPEFADLPEKRLPSVAEPRKVAHALDGLAEDLQARLAGLGLASSVRSIDIDRQRKSPILMVEKGCLVLAGRCSTLHRVQAERLASTILYSPALSLLLSHSLTLLNENLSEVTNSAEHRSLLALLGSRF